MASIDQLTWAYQTGVLNNVLTPNNLVHTKLYTNHQTVPTEDIEIGIVEKGREAAPFVRVNGEAILVTGATERFQTVKPPNIRIKRAFTPSELLFGRRPGSNIFLTGANDLKSEIDTYIARETGIMGDLIANTQELLACQSLTGAISYSNEFGDVFTITAPRDAGQNIDLGAGNYWSSAVDPYVTVHLIKRLMSAQAGGLQPTDALLGQLASDALRGNAAAKAAFSQQNQTMGLLDQSAFFLANGAIFLGRLYGINFWEYPRTVAVNGVATDLIRSKYAEFVSFGAAIEAVEYFAPISDMEALQSANGLVAERFAKSWMIPDPSSMIQLATSRPLPWLRRPNGTASVRIAA